MVWRLSFTRAAGFRARTRLDRNLFRDRSLISIFKRAPVRRSFGPRRACRNHEACATGVRHGDGQPTHRGPVIVLGCRLPVVCAVQPITMSWLAALAY